MKEEEKTLPFVERALLLELADRLTISDMGVIVTALWHYRDNEKKLANNGWPNVDGGFRNALRTLSFLDYKDAERILERLGRIRYYIQEPKGFLHTYDKLYKAESEERRE